MSTGIVHPRTRDRLLKSVVRLWTWLMMVFIVVPLLVISIMAFNAGEFLVFPPDGISLRWFEATLTDSSWLVSIQNSVIVAAGAATIATTVGGTAAYALYRYDYRLGSSLAAMSTIPILVPPVVLGIMFLTFFAAIGVTGSMVNLVIAHAIFLTPFSFFLTSQGLQEIDDTYEEAARDLGATQGTVIRTITVPLVRANVVAGFLFAAILSLNEFIISWLLAGFVVDTVPIQIFTSLRYNYSPTIAVISILFIVVTLAGLLIVDHLSGGIWES